MTLFRDELLTVQDEYLKDNISRVDPEDDDEVGYDNDDLGENAEITPIGDDLDEDDIDDTFKVDPDEEDDLLEDDDDVLLDDEELLDDDDEKVVDSYEIEAIGGDDDDLEDEDDELLDDDFDDDETAEVIPDDDEDLLADDDDDLDDFDNDDDDLGSTTQGLNHSIDVDVPGRSSSSILDHEPGTASSRNI